MNNMWQENSNCIKIKEKSNNHANTNPVKQKLVHNCIFLQMHVQLILQKHLLKWFHFGFMFDRSKYRASEMPQAFRYEIIKKAYEQVCLAATFYLLRKERLRHFTRIPIWL